MLYLVAIFAAFLVAVFAAFYYTANTWVDIGSSYLPSEVIAAFLWAQLEQAEYIMKRRAEIWRQYYELFADLEWEGRVRRPVIPRECSNNAHLFYLLFPDLKRRSLFLQRCKNIGIGAVFHYVPLHSSPAGMRYGRTCGDLAITVDLSNRLVRLPLWVGMEQDVVEWIIDEVIRIVKEL
ncbi:MAG: dTDP-4-amino-4,6-dideoxygalactose transaminase [Pelotomaculum sp. PtaB.Bin104]|nr:MAG: dTDP-4-amino-4,6-dideoxygalactose transaminase [Pelotomaculum sp. PtaB.Bin104]